MKAIINENELVERIRRQERGAFEILYKMYSKNLLYVINRIIADNEMKYDILQEVMTKIWHQVGHYNDAKGKFYTWMISITRNHTYDIVRSKRYINSKRNMNIEDVHSAENKIIMNYNPDTIDVKSLVSKLRPEQKKIFELFYMQGYTHTEIAEILSLPLGTVKSRITIGIKVLRKHYKYYNPFHAVGNDPLNDEYIKWVPTEKSAPAEESKDLKEDILVVEEPKDLKEDIHIVKKPRNLKKDIHIVEKPKALKAAIFVVEKPRNLKEDKPVVEKPVQKIFDDPLKEPDLFDMIWFGLMTPQETAKKLNISLRSSRKLYEMNTQKLKHFVNEYKSAGQVSSAP